MGNKLYLIKEGEISLKGGNRNLFEKQLRHNIKNKLRPYHSDITKQKGRLYAEISDEAPDELVEKALSTTSGITAFARAYMTEKNIESIIAKALEILPSSDFKNGESFRVTVKRDIMRTCRCRLLALSGDDCRLKASRAHAHMRNQE